MSLVTDLSVHVLYTYIWLLGQIEATNQCYFSIFLCISWISFYFYVFSFNFNFSLVCFSYVLLSFFFLFSSKTWLLEMFVCKMTMLAQNLPLCIWTVFKSVFFFPTFNELSFVTLWIELQWCGYQWINTFRWRHVIRYLRLLSVIGWQWQPWIIISECHGKTNTFSGLLHFLYMNMNVDIYVSC